MQSAGNAGVFLGDFCVWWAQLELTLWRVFEDTLKRELQLYLPHQAALSNRRGHAYGHHDDGVGNDHSSGSR